MVILLSAPVVGLVGMEELPVLAFWHRQASDRTAPFASLQAEKGGPALRSESPIPRLLVQDARGTTGEPLQLSMSLQGEADGAFAMITGLIPGMTFSMGTAVGADGWRVRATDFEDIWIGPPTQFVGEVDLMVELHLADQSIADRRLIHLQWGATTSVLASANPPISAQPSPRLDPEEIAILVERAKGLIASGDLAAARLVLRRAAESLTQASAEPIDTPAPVAPAMSAQSDDSAGEASTQRVAGWPVTLDQNFMDRTAVATDPGDAHRPAATGSNPSAPIECLPEGLRAVLADVEARFGPVTIVSTTHLHTDNHSPGTIREKLHFACKAVDIKTPHQPNDVIAFLRSRPEVGGINTYRNQVIHFDLNANYGQTASNPSTAQQRRAGVKAQRHPQARVGATAQVPSPKAAVMHGRPTSQPTQQGEAASNTGGPLTLDQLFSRGSLPTNSPINAFRE